VRLTPVVAKTTRSEMPAAPSLLMKKRVYTFLKVDAGVSPERIPAFRVGDYVRPRGARGGGATMGTIVAPPKRCRGEFHQQAGEGPLSAMMRCRCLRTTTLTSIPLLVFSRSGTHHKPLNLSWLADWKLKNELTY
jgi:hypothetical protein